MIHPTCLGKWGVFFARGHGFKFVALFIHNVS